MRLLLIYSHLVYYSGLMTDPAKFSFSGIYTLGDHQPNQMKYLENGNLHGFRNNFLRLLNIVCASSNFFK